MQGSRSVRGVWVFVLVCWMLPGCKSGPEDRPNRSYRTSAKENFIKGKEAFDDEDYLEAVEYFRFVKTKFPYSTYATQSELYLADCDFGRERFLEAADGYANFIKMHPKHPKVAYASFRIGECYFNRIPDSWWLLPPAYELDQIETERAIRELRTYLKLFPQDENVPQAKDMLGKALERMAERSYYVMEFYRKRGHHRGVLWRAEELLKNFGGFRFDEEVLYRKAEALAGLKEGPACRKAVEEYLQRFPQGRFASKAQDLLQRDLGTPPVGPGATQKP